MKEEFLLLYETEQGTKTLVIDKIDEEKALQRAQKVWQGVKESTRNLKREPNPRFKVIKTYIISME